MMAYYNGRPCAACTHQRIKCSPQCIFAPYFPPEQNQNFLNVKEVYGVNNVKEILSALDPKDRAAAVTSMCHMAEIRLKQPVHVSVGYVAHPQQRLKRLNTELASVYEELGTLSAGPSTGTMPRQQPDAAYGQMVYDPLQQQRRMMGVQLSSPAAVPYGAATSASHQAQMMGFGNNPSSDVVATTDQLQLGVQLSSSAAQMDAPAVHGRAGKQIMMGVGLGNPSSSTSGQQHYGIDVDARQYAVLVASHQHQPQPQLATPINAVFRTSNSSSEAPIDAIPINAVFPKKRRIWTSQLQQLFADIVNELGGQAAAKPGMILQRLIIVDPTFTYQEVASKLQSYRSKKA